MPRGVGVRVPLSAQATFFEVAFVFYAGKGTYKRARNGAEMLC